MTIVERTLLAVLLAATLAILLLVGRNGLAPLQHPLSFGLVLWGWTALFYSAVGAGALILAGAASRWRGPRAALGPAFFAATACFTAVALAGNRRAFSSLFLLEGEARFRALAPASAVLCAIALVAVGAPLTRGRAILRGLALLAVAGGLLALVPQGADDAASGGGTAGARLQGLPFVLVGVDGADWDLMEPLLARGDLPHLRSIKESGAWGRIETLRPTLSPAIWTSMVTGKRPRRHGVLDFTTRRLRGVEESLPGLHPLKGLGFPFLLARLEAAGQVFEAPITSYTRRVPAFWNVAAARGSPVSVVNWWGTWPAEPVLGDIVSERAYYHELLHRGQAAAEAGLTYPEDLYAKVAPLIVLPDEVTLGDAQAFMDVTAAEFEPMRAVKHPSRQTGIANEFTYFLSTFATNERLALRLVERSRQRYGQPADLLVLFRLVDKTCHTALVYSELVDEHPGASPDELRRYGRVVSEAYRAVDRALGRIRQAFGAANVIVVSDHGFAIEGAKAGHSAAPPGVFLAAGPAFRPGRVDGLSVLDVMPLLLYLKGFPLARDVDGRLPAEVLQPGLLAARPPGHVETYGKQGRTAARAGGGSDVDAAMIERLRALGYLR
jgi:hypothetical protein